MAAGGGLNSVVAWAVRTGLVSTPGWYDATAQLGHAAWWDPLFLT